MAENTGNEITEDIVLELKTNFESELRNAAAQYSSFQKKAGNVSRSVEQNINSMYKQVSSNLSSMMRGVQSTVASSINMTRGAMRETQNESIKLSKTYETYVNRMLQLQNKVRSVADDKIMQPTGKAEAIKGLDKIAKEETVKAANDMFLQLGSISKNASQTIFKSVNDSFNSIKQLAKGTKDTLVDLQVAINNSGKAGNVSVAKESISKIDEQLKGARTALKEQAKQVVAAEQEMQNARTAMQGQTDAKLLVQQEQYFKQTVQNVTRIQKAYHDTEKQVAKLSETIAQGKNKITQGAEGVKNKIKLEIDSTNVDSQFKSIMSNFKESISLAASGISKEFKNSVDQGQILKSTLNGNVKALENMLSEAKKLHATGLVDASGEISKIESILNKTKEFKTEFKEIQKLANFFDIAKWNEKINQAKKSITDLRAKIDETLNAEPKLKPKKSNIYDLQKAKENLDNIAKLEQQMVNERKKVEKDIQDIEKQSQKVRLQITKQTNQEVIESLNETQNILQNKANELRSILNSAFSPDTSKLQKDVANTAKRMHKEITDSLKNISKEPKEEFDKIKAMFVDLNNKYGKLSTKKLIGDKTVSDFKAKSEIITNAVKKYDDEIKILMANIEKLQKLQKMGLAPKSSADLEQMKAQLTEMKRNASELNQIRMKAINQSEALARQASKGLFRHGWEMIRNFRWQVAGLIYLVTKAVNAIKQTFVKTLSDVQKFRIDAMSIAASMVYSIVGNTKESFAIAYEYSKELLRKMELEAARTILTLEDMTMLVKTFSQAGMVPKSDDDVRKIATIGTAIKTLTEGMANAGVQMRQELYAVIQGRQRATDQLAMMFKFVGVNIQKVMDEAKKEGKSIIEALAKALEPFEEVNKKLGDEYQTQINKLNIIWDRIKRIGADSTLDALAKTIKELNASFMDSKGNLTDAGLGLAKALQFAMEIMNSIVVQLGSAFGSLVDLDQKSTAWATALNVVNGFLFVTAELIDEILTDLSLVVNKTRGFYNYLLLEFKEAKKFMDAADSSDEKRNQRMINRLNALADANDRMQKTFENAKNEALKLGAVLLNLPFSDFEAIEKMSTKINEAKRNALSEPQKIEFDYSLGIESTKAIKEGLINNYNTILKAYNAAVAKGVKLDDEQTESIKNRVQAQIDGLAMIRNYEKALYDEKMHKLAELNKKGSKEEINWTSQIDSFRESLNKAESPLEKLEKRWTKISIEFKNLYAKAPEEFKKQLKEIEKIMPDIFKLESDVIFDDMEAEFNSVMESIKSHEVLSPFERINNEMDKMILNFSKNDKLSDEMKKNLLEAANIAKAERMELEGISLELEKQNAIFRARNSYADLVGTGYRPKDKQLADLLALEAQYKQSAKSIMAEIDKISDKWATDKNGIPESEKQRIKALEQELTNLGKSLDFHKKQVQEPFWNDLREMSKGWFDDFADVLNEAAFNLDSFSENFRQFITDIAREASRAWIKRNITDNLMNLLPDLTGEKKEGEKGAKAEIFDVMKKGWEKTSEMFKGGFDKFVEISGKGFDLLKSGLSSIFDTIMSMFSSENISGAWDALIGIGSSIAGMFGVGGGTTKMADGGIIKEPIIGRGLRSGTTYNFGEGGKPELVTPLSQLKSSGTNNLSISIPVSVSGGMDNRTIARLKSELQRVTEETTLRIIKEHS